MKVVKTITVRYVVPETEDERREIENLINEVRSEKLGRDFQLSDLKKIAPENQSSGGHWIENP